MAAGSGLDTPHLPTPAPIDAYGNGGFRFGGMSHRGSLLCFPDGVWAWPVASVAAILSGLSRHAARGQVYIPQEVLDRHDVPREQVLARRDSEPLKAALAELRRHARRQLAAGRADMADAPAALLPALLPVALVAPTLRPMDRRGYEPFDVPPLSQLRRQWLLWRAARDPSRIFGA